MFFGKITNQSGEDRRTSKEHSVGADGTSNCERAPRTAFRVSAFAVPLRRLPLLRSGPALPPSGQAGSPLPFRRPLRHLVAQFLGLLLQLPHLPLPIRRFVLRQPPCHVLRPM